MEMVKSVCPYCGGENRMITWTLTDVRCGHCWNQFHYSKIKIVVTPEKQSQQKSKV